MQKAHSSGGDTGEVRMGGASTGGGTGLVTHGAGTGSDARDGSAIGWEGHFDAGGTSDGAVALGWDSEKDVARVAGTADGPGMEKTDGASDSGDESCCETEDEDGGVGPHAGTGRVGNTRGSSDPFVGAFVGVTRFTPLARLASIRWNIQSTLSSSGVSNGIIVRHVTRSGSVTPGE